MVNTDGEVEKISEATDPERMRAIRSSYGLFGRIFEVTFRIQKQTTLSYSHESFRLTSLPIRAELFGGADSMFDGAKRSRRTVSEQVFQGPDLVSRRVTDSGAHLTSITSMETRTTVGVQEHVLRCERTAIRVLRLRLILERNCHDADR